MQDTVSGCLGGTKNKSYTQEVSYLMWELLCSRNNPIVKYKHNNAVYEC